jgi:hypothetical protein
MTSGAATLLETAREPAHTAARSARVVEFLLVGGISLVLLPLAWLFRQAAGLDAAELTVGFLAFHAAYLINDPHFSVTYLLFYRDVRRRAFGDAFSPLQRARYLAAGFAAPLVLAGWGALALASGSAFTLGLLIQLMFFLVGWHYVKQGFGVLSVLSARRGFRFSALERNVLLAHCLAGWAYAWASPADPGITVEEKGVVYDSLPRPAALELVTGIVFLLSTLALIGLLARKWQRERRLPPLAPLAGLLITVWLWTVYSSLDPLMVYVIPALHSIQYLYFVWLLKRNEAREQEGPPDFGRPVGVRLGMLAASALALGWLLFHGAPEFLDTAFSARNADDPALSGALGPTPYVAALFAFVNIHHYCMDAVIWRRDNPETRFLQS